MKRFVYFLGRLVIVRCNICAGRKTIDAEDLGPIKCPACSGSGDVTLTQYFLQKKFLKLRNKNGRGEK